MIKIALIQTDCVREPEKNIEKAFHQIKNAAEKGANIIALQELFHTTYFCREIDPAYFQWAQAIPGDLTDRLCKLAGKLNVVLLAPLFERKAAGVYFNSMAVIDADGSLMGVYRKMHIPDDPGFYEKYYFTPGDSGYQVYDTAFGKIGTLICWDQWYPEAARITAMMGADLLVYPTAIATLPEEDESEKQQFLEAWQMIQRSHAIANGCYVASINRVGDESGSKFWGRSFAAGPFGEIIAGAGEGEEILMADLDFSRIEKQRQAWPFFRDRRIDTYEPILKRWI